MEKFQKSVSMDDKGNITMDCEDDSDYAIFIDEYVLEPEKKNK